MQGFVLQGFSNPNKRSLVRHFLDPQIVFQSIALIITIFREWKFGHWNEEYMTFIGCGAIGLFVTAISLTIEAIESKIYRSAIMAEAAGDHTNAIEIIRKYGSPQLLSTYRQRYQNDLANQNQIAQPNVPSQTQNPSVINIHNVQTQQGPTEINVQDSVVTDWNQ